MSTMWSFLITCEQLRILLLSILRKWSACRNALLKHLKHAISRVVERVMCGSAMWWGPIPTPLLPLSHPSPIYCGIRAMPIKYEQVTIILWHSSSNRLNTYGKLEKTICWIRRLSSMLIIRVTIFLVYRYSLKHMSPFVAWRFYVQVCSHTA